LYSVPSASQKPKDELILERLGLGDIRVEGTVVAVGTDSVGMQRTPLAAFLTAILVSSKATVERDRGSRSIKRST
jgi:hypothetical protein